MNVSKALDYASSPFVRDAEMQVSTTPTIIDGKVLSTPPMQYGRGAQPLVRHPSYRVNVIPTLP